MYIQDYQLLQYNLAKVIVNAFLKGVIELQAFVFKNFRGSVDTSPEFSKELNLNTYTNRGFSSSTEEL